MKTITQLARTSISLFLLVPSISFAAGSYSESLKAADEALGAQHNDLAIKEVEVALTQASNDGERALALAKKGYLLAFTKKDYTAARTAVDEALKVEGLAPVAKVTALQSLAECQIKAEKNYTGAIANLQSALALEGVDWAKPILTMTLAECYRSTGKLEDALVQFRALTDMAQAGADLKAGAYLNIGFIYQYDRKDFAKAKEAYTSAVKQRPALQTEVNGHLGRMTEL